MSGLVEIGKDRPLVLVGYGKMGGALAEGWLARGLKREGLVVVEPALAPGKAVAKGVKRVADAEALPAGLQPRVVLFAVKPQSMPAVLPAYARFAGKDCLFVSIAAGKPIRSYEAALGNAARVVRSMPNTPAAIGRGMTVACAGSQVRKSDRALATKLLEAVGEVAWVEAEALLDPVTAVSGSGPAYVFLLIECLAAAGAESGLPADIAERLARATVAGAGELARLSSEEASVLRKNVTSPGGTTEAALDVLLGEAGLGPLMRRAVQAATKRSRELAG